MTSFEAGHAQIQGSLRRQEDACVVLHLAEGALLAVAADGMGGPPAGHLASEAAVDCARAAIETDSNPQTAFPHILAQARDRLSALEQADASVKGLGTTLVCAHLSAGRELRWLNVGDSHLYLLRGRSLRHLSQIHNLGAVLEAQGGETQPGDHTLEPALYSHILMSAVSAKEPDLVDLRTEPFPLQPGDRLLLATDGIDLLNLDDLRRLLAGDGNPQEIADTLLEKVAAREVAHQDNATAIVICVS